MAQAEDVRRIAVATRIATYIVVAYLAGVALYHGWEDIYDSFIAVMAHGVSDLWSGSNDLFAIPFVVAALYILFRIGLSISRRLESGQRFGALSALMFWSTLFAWAVPTIAQAFLPSDFYAWCGNALTPGIVDTWSLSFGTILELVLFTAAYAAFFLIAVRLTSSPGTGHRTRLFDDAGKVRYLVAGQIFLLSALAFLTWSYGAWLVGYAVSYADLSGLPPILARIAALVVWPLGGATEFLILTAPIAPFLVAVWLPVGWMTMTTVADGNSVHIALRGLDISLLRAPWNRVRRIDVIRHMNSPPSVIVHYWTWFRMPFSFGVHAKHYQDGVSVGDEVVTQAEKAGIRKNELFSPDWTVPIAYLLLAAGVGIAFYLPLRMTGLFERYLQPDFPVERFPEIYDPLGLASISVVSVVCVGIWLGMLSAFHRGGPRPILATMWILAASHWSQPLIHWLVWFAMYAIFAAIPQPLVPFPMIDPPPLWQMELGLDAVNLLPAFAGLGYVLGVVAGCRRMRVQSTRGS